MDLDAQHRPLVRLALLLLVLATPAGAACRQALALGLDVSGSVDAAEYRLQLDGLAGALTSPEVRQAFLDLPATPVRIMVYEWAGLGSLRTLVPWTEIRTEADLNGIANTLVATPRIKFEPPTAIGQALLIGGRKLAEQRECWRHTLDLSGDGKSNTGPRPRDVKGDPLLADIIVNGLVIGTDDQGHGDARQSEVAELWAYYQAEVIHGPGAFVEVALGFQDYEKAMARKLLKELQTFAVSSLRP